MGTKCRDVTRVHPRACGGNSELARLEYPDLGPSPRVRGKLGGKHAALVHPRSIPARAGETRPYRSIPARAGEIGPQVHPRACGGNTLAWTSHRASSSRGPSPRVRGPVADHDLGSIPARAGETLTKRPDHDLRVHPRACGGNRRLGSATHAIPGPSPRVRGKRTGVDHRIE